MGRLKAGLLLFLGVFAAYAYTAYPTVAPRDSADLAAAALTVAPAHAPGYPLYALLGKAWLDFLPWGDPAYRLNLLSAAAGAGCAALVFLLLVRSCGLWAGLAAALALAFSAPLWKFSLLCEMYSWHGFFLAALLWLAPLPGQERTSTRRREAASALIFGLGLVNHQALVLAAPGLAVLWWGELKAAGNRVFLQRVCLPLFLLGLGLYAFLWVRTGDFDRAWGLLTRREYGTWQLSESFGQSMSLGLVWRLPAYCCGELWRRTSPLVIGLALLGAGELWRRSRRGAAGLTIVFLGVGPVFFLATRFDVNGWVARTVLESAMIAPTVVLCTAAGFGLAWAGRRWKAWGAALATAAAAATLWAQAAPCFHRDDFSAYDYVKDLRRALPPGRLAAAAGDTALYATRYLDLTQPDGRGRRLVSFQDASEGERPGFVLGLSLPRLASLGLGPETLSPAGLVQAVGPGPGDDSFWSLSVLRRGRALRLQESYASDVLLAYAFAHYLDGTLQDSRHAPGAGRNYVMAAALDPEDFQIRYNTAR